MPARDLAPGEVVHRTVNLKVLVLTPAGGVGPALVADPVRRLRCTTCTCDPKDRLSPVADRVGVVRSRPRPSSRSPRLSVIDGRSVPSPFQTHVNVGGCALGISRWPSTAAIGPAVSGSADWPSSSMRQSSVASEVVWSPSSRSVRRPEPESVTVKPMLTEVGRLTRLFRRRRSVADDRPLPVNRQPERVRRRRSYGDGVAVQRLNLLAYIGTNSPFIVATVLAVVFTVPGRRDDPEHLPRRSLVPL